MDCHDGKTMNERLYHFGLLDEFYIYIKQRNENAAIDVLTQAKYSNEQAKETVHELLNSI